jgi:putative flippase GtrA
MLALLGIYGRRLARKAGIATNDWFVGVRYAGRMSAAATESGLRAIVASGEGGETELLFHPGEALSSEVLEWSGDCHWHFSPWRTKERAYLMSEHARVLYEEFRAGTLLPGTNLDKILRYIISGGLAAFTHLGALYILTDHVGMWFVTANVLAFCFGLIVSFGLQKLWTFGDRRSQGVHRQALWYALVQVLSLGIDTVLLYVLVTYAGWWYLGAQFLLLILIAVGNFFIFNRVIFRNHGNS